MDDEAADAVAEDGEGEQGTSGECSAYQGVQSLPLKDKLILLRTQPSFKQWSSFTLG